MSEKFLASYSLLGLKPDAGWNELRALYRQKVSTWHPDRFHADPSQRKLREEKTKAINAAYAELSDYYRAYGQLPLQGMTEDIAPLPAVEINPPSSPSASTAATGARSEAPIMAPAGIPPHIVTRGAFWVVLFMALISATYLVSPMPDPHPAEPPGNDPQRSAAAKSAATDDAHSLAAKSPKHIFTAGATVGEVYAIQGIPTRIENNIWYYGKSEVYFVKGAVSRWINHPDSPLRVRPDTEPPGAPLFFFTYGSSKAEVRTVQGAPTRETPAVWEYGPSKVHFKGDHVSGWDESPLSPLRIEK